MKKLVDYLPVSAAVLSMVAEAFKGFLKDDARKLTEPRGRKTKSEVRESRKTGRGNVVASRKRPRRKVK